MLGTMMLFTLSLQSHLIPDGCEPITVTMDPERHNSLLTRLGDGLEKSLEVSKYTAEILFRFFKGLIELKGLTGLFLRIMAVGLKIGNSDFERLKFEF